MAIKLIRQESDTPNVTNYDDARMARYAYGGYDGYVKERGTEIDSEVDGSTFVVKSGVLVLQGWEAEIDANGVRIGVTESDATLRYYVVYLEINRAADTTEVKALSDTAGYPDLPQSDDLTKNIIGTARLPLYRFTAQSGVISNVSKKVQEIEYTSKKVGDIRGDLENGSLVVKIASYASADTSKGTIEQRLNNLGFKRGYASIKGTGGITLKRQGNYVIAQIYSSNVTPGNTIAVISENFRPKENQSSIIGCNAYTDGGLVYGYVTLSIRSNGEVFISSVAQSSQHLIARYISYINVTIGYEAAPL